jgi:hypothetical protein
MAKEELLDLNQVCSKAPEWAKGKHSILSMTDDTDGTVSWCGFNCGWSHHTPAPERDFWGREIDPWFEKNY